MPLPLGKDWLNVEYFDGIDIFFIDLVSKKGLIFFGQYIKKSATVSRWKKAVSKATKAAN